MTICNFQKKNQQNFRLVYHSLMNDSLFYWFSDDSEASLYQTQWEEYYNQLAESESGVVNKNQDLLGFSSQNAVKDK